MDIGFFGSIYDFIHGCSRFPIGNIFLDRAAEEIYILLDDADLPAQGFQSQGADILAVYGDPALADIVESGKQGTDGGFAASGGTYQGDGSSGRNLEGNIGKNRRVVVAVVEGYVLVGYEAMHLLKPVSYTHLDVYKRQDHVYNKIQCKRQKMSVFSI